MRWVRNKGVCRWIRSNFFVAEMFYKFNDERFFGGEVEKGLRGLRSLFGAGVVKLFWGGCESVVSMISILMKTYFFL